MRYSSVGANVGLLAAVAVLALLLSIYELKPNKSFISLVDYLLLLWQATVMHN
jgi:hypothetical protein